MGLESQGHLLNLVENLKGAGVSNAAHHAISAYARSSGEDYFACLLKAVINLTVIYNASAAGHNVFSDGGVIDLGKYAEAALGASDKTLGLDKDDDGSGTVH